MREDPRWNIGRPCVQDHEHVVVNYYYTTTVLNTTPFNVPKIGEEIEIVLDKVISVLVGAVLWNPTIGSLLVKSFNKDSNSVVITSDNLLVDYGKSVLANTEFLVSVPDYNLPTEDDYLNAPYLAADFISPAEGACQNVSVTTVAGINIGNKVSIAGYVYRVGAIIDKATLKLCNDGEGAPEGTVLAWDTRDCGKPSVPVIVYSSSPCESTPVQTGQLVVCKDKAMTILSGEADGQMIRWNNNFKRWELVNAYLDENCTYLTTCLTIDILDDENLSYLANVKSTNLFGSENKIIIDDEVFSVTEIVSSTQMRIKPQNTFTEITTYPVGTSVCLESCCAWVPAKLKETIEDDCWRPASLQNYILNWASVKKIENTSSSQPLSDISIGGSKTISGDEFNIYNIVNYSECYQLILHVRFYTFISGLIPAHNGEDIRMSTQMHNEIKVKFANETNPQDCSQDTFDVVYAPSDNSNRPQGYALCQEREVIIPPYNKDEEEKSTVSILCKFDFHNLSGSDKKFTFGNDPERNYMEARLYITGNYNNVK